MRIERLKVMMEDKKRKEWKKNYLIGVKEKEGEMMVIINVYFGFIGIMKKREIELGVEEYKVEIELMMVRRMKVYNGK